jgi:hypothetical protein
MGSLLRFEKVFKRTGVDGDWTYCQEWVFADHPQSGIECLYDMPDTSELGPLQAFAYAQESEFPVKASETLLKHWQCGSIN